MKNLWDIQEYDPNNAFLIKENMWKRNTGAHNNQSNKMDLKIS